MVVLGIDRNEMDIFKVHDVGWALLRSAGAEMLLSGAGMLKNETSRREGAFW